MTVGPLPSVPSISFGPVDPNGPIPSASQLSTLATAQAALLAAVADITHPQLSLSTYYQTVAASLVLQKAQDILNKLSDIENQQRILQNAINEAATAQSTINDAYTYQELQTQVNRILNPQKDDLNGYIDGYNMFVTTQAAAAQQLSDAYAIALPQQSAYQDALTTYLPQLNDFNATNAAYADALTAWQSALKEYSLGTIDSTQLETARTVFDQAQTTYNTNWSQFYITDTAHFSIIASSWVTAEGMLQDAMSTFNTQVNNTNQFSIDLLNAAINRWNTAVSTATPLINQMNLLRAGSLQLPPLPLPLIPDQVPPIPLVYMMSSTSDPPDPLTFPVEGGLALYNQNSTTNNVTIADINTLISSLSDYRPRLDAVPIQAPLFFGGLPLSNYTITPIPEMTAIDPYTASSLQIPPLIDTTVIVRAEVAILAVALEGIKKNDTEIDPTNTTKIKKKLTSPIGGLLGGVTLNSIANVSYDPHPQSQAIVATQMIDAYFARYGLSVGSPLVDHSHNFLSLIQKNAGLLSAAPAHTLLINSTTPPTDTALSTATALGLIQVAQSLTESSQLPQAFEQLLNTLPDQVRIPLSEDLAKVVGGLLLAEGVEQLAIALGIPGLVPHLLALSEEAIPVSNDQLFVALFTNTLKQISSQIPESILTTITDRLATALKEQAPFNIQTFAASLEGISDSTRAQIIQALIDTQQTIQQERALSEQHAADQLADLIRDALKDNVLIDQATIEGIIQQVIPEQPTAPVQQVASEPPTFSPPPPSLFTEESIRPKLFYALIGAALSTREAAQVTDAVVTKASTEINNPLNTPLAPAVPLSLPILQAHLAASITRPLAPVIGEKRAEQVGQDFSARLITSANSVVNMLQEYRTNSARLLNLSESQSAIQSYISAFSSFTDPLSAEIHPLRTGRTLLMTGLVGGPGVQGSTSIEHDPHFKQPISIPI